MISFALNWDAQTFLDPSIPLLEYPSTRIQKPGSKMSQEAKNTSTTFQKEVTK